MTTKLDGVVKRELRIKGEPFTLTLSEDGFVLTLKGRRKGLDIRWADLVSGEAALAAALNASLTANILPSHKFAPKASGEARQPRSTRKRGDMKDEERPAGPKAKPRARPRVKRTHPGT